VNPVHNGKSKTKKPESVGFLEITNCSMQNSRRRGIMLKKQGGTANESGTT
jgi:hypothetical protein